MKIAFLLFFLLFHCTEKSQKTPTAEPKIEHIPITEFDTLPKKRGLHAEHYPASNERRIDLFVPYIKNIGGGYIGVGTDQNFSFAAIAKSEYVWLMDLTRI